MNLEKKIILTVIIAGGIYSTFLIFSDFKLIYDKISNFQLSFLPIILLLVFVNWVVLFFRWTVILKHNGITIPFKENFLIFFASFALAVSPGKSGELLKSILLKNKFNIKRSLTVPLIIIERFYDLLGALIIVIIGLWFLIDELIPVAIGATVLLTLIYVGFYSRKFFNVILNLTNRIPFLSKFSSSITDSHDIIKKSSRGKISLISILLTIVHRLIESFAVYLVLLAFGIDVIDYFHTTVIYAASVIIGAISFIPGGLGITESSLAGLLSLHGLDISTAFAVAITIRIFTLWYGVLFGFITLKLSGSLDFNYKD